MKLLNKYIGSFALILVLFVVTNCKIFDLDINDDPNNPVSISSPELLLTNIEYTLTQGVFTFSDQSLGIMGLYSTGGDGFGYSQTSFNGTWNNLYSGPLKDIEGLIAASSDPINPKYLGIAQVLKAWAISNMVDMWGDLPYSQALKGDAADAVTDPSFDKDADIYADCFKLLDDATKNFGISSAVSVAGDLFYAGNISRWTKLANTLKLRLKLQTRLVNGSAKSEIEALMADPAKLISTSADDFQFQYSKAKNPQDYRHPWYQDGYGASQYGLTYMLHQNVVEMLEQKDPRTPFYYRRQTKRILDPANPSDRGTIPCSQTSGCTYGYIVLNPNMWPRVIGTSTPTTAQNEFMAGLFGRDRADPAGVPQDSDFRLMAGVYPAGGFYDVTAACLPGTDKAPGGGIFPIITSVNTLYYRIEAILALGSAGDARALFVSAIKDHIKKVVDFGAAADANAVRPTTAAIDDYVKIWTDRWDAQPNSAGKLNLALKQLWASSMGSGIEIYNAYRRTGFPNTIQEPINPTRGFPLRLPYPQAELTLNPNAANYKAVAFDKDPIFWDK
ncbi:MAG: SusD/RagB family nutrient-binding outer membrane lipoprotein [Saprospiraceae bacterium]|nr:SusD/RagB family nutrient-binding outer membrane lipoprotein [Saprospiraceae bacterium]